MKIQKKEVSKVFQPITLEITIESEDDLRMLKQLSQEYEDTARAIEGASLIDEEYEENLADLLRAVKLLLM